MSERVSSEPVSSERVSSERVSEPGPLSFHVPAPAVRPGGTPDFSDVEISRAGEVRRPEIDVAPEEIRDLAFAIIRVLDRNSEAVGPWAGLLTDQELLEGLRHMMTLRAFDARMQMAQRQGKTSFYMQHLGEEAVSCAFRKALEPGDMNFPTYRQAGLLIAGGYPMLDMMNQIYSNELDPMKGRQLPVMYSSREHGFFSISGNLATQYIQAVGWAMASAMKRDTRIAAGWIGDGSTAESDFHAALVFASTYKAPVVLNIVNNQWAISTFQGIARGGAGTFAARGLGFGIPSLRVDGNDYLATHAVAKWAVERARRNLGPTLIEYVTYRVGAHSTSDDPSAYRPKTESDAWPLGDPVLRLKNHLIRRGVWTEDRHKQAEAEIMAGVIAVQKEAETHGTLHTGPHPSARDMFEGVYEQMPPHLRRQRQQGGV
jgi:2-oxoisovalerate dehydrogenase E1 component alpha subunit